MRANIAEDERRRWRRIYKSSVAFSAHGKMLSCADEMPEAMANEGGAGTG
jgi:hypothetical protein